MECAHCSSQAMEDSQLKHVKYSLTSVRKHSLAGAVGCLRDLTVTLVYAMD